MDITLNGYIPAYPTNNPHTEEALDDAKLMVCGELTVTGGLGGAVYTDEVANIKSVMKKSYATKDVEGSKSGGASGNFQATKVLGAKLICDGTEYVWLNDGTLVDASTGSFYTLIFDANGGAGDLLIYVAKDGGAIQLPAALADYKTDGILGSLGEKTYTFNGWKIGSTTYSAGASYTPTGNATFTAVWKESGGGGCVTPDTLITLADGTQVRVDSLTGNEMLLVWNHQTGKLEMAPVAYIVSHNGVVSMREVIRLIFANGNEVKIVEEHVFYDVTLGKYVAITSENAEFFQGHTFLALSEDGTELQEVELVSVVREMRETAVYEVVTYQHLTCFTEGILSASAYLDPLLNIFAIDEETFAYDAEQLQKDIETYGLYTYADFEGLITEEAFVLYNAAYLKIAIGKGYIVWDDIVEMIEIYFNVGVDPIQ